MSFPVIQSWNTDNEGTNIEVTVALPAYNSEKIIWLALESLRRQTNITFDWELIIMEEYGKSKEIVNQFLEKLPGCKRVVHYNVIPEIHGLKSGPLIGKYPLINKWIQIAKYASPTSKVFVMHAADCYSSPKRLSIHYSHFKENTCYFSTQPRGLFFNLQTKQKMVYNGYLIDKRKLRGNHLNMALRTDDMRQIKMKDISSGIDGYIRLSIRLLHPSMDFDNINYILSDDIIDSNSWKYSIDTDGANNISLKRRSHYNILEKNVRSAHYQQYKQYAAALAYKPIQTYIPKNVLEFLYNYK